MKTLNLVLAITILIAQTSLAQTTVTGKLGNYKGRSAVVKAVTGVEVGTINSSGEFSLSLDNQVVEGVKTKMGKRGLPNLEERFNTCRKKGTGTMEVENGGQTYLTLLNADSFRLYKGRDNTGKFVLVSSESFENSKLFGYTRTAKLGYMVNWLYVKKPSRIKGHCTRKNRKRTDGVSFTRTFHADLDLKAGWNMIKISVDELYTAKTGEKFIQKVSFASIDHLPEDVVYAYTNYE